MQLDNDDANGATTANSIKSDADAGLSPAPPPASATTQLNTITVPTTTGVTQSGQFTVTQAGFWTVKPNPATDNGSAQEESSPTWYVNNAASNEPVLQANFDQFLPQFVYLAAGTYDISLTNWNPVDAYGGAPQFFVNALTPTPATAGQAIDLGQVGRRPNRLRSPSIRTR